MFNFGKKRGENPNTWYVRDKDDKIVNRGVGDWKEVDEHGRIWRGVDADGREIRTTDEEEELNAIKLQKWQRAKFARELGFNPDTKDNTELAAIDKKYEEMIQKVNEWNEEQKNALDEALKKARGDS